MSWTTYLQGLGINVICVFLLWLCSIALTNVSIIDIYWGFGFVLLSWFYYLSAPYVPSSRQTLLLTLITLCGLRLALYLGIRSIGHGEDKRYAAFRKRAGPSYWWTSLFSVFLLQGVIQWILSGMFMVGLSTNGPQTITVIDIIGAIIWTIGFLFESIGDYQLYSFKKQARSGDILDTGLWKYTRHPNYFGHSTMWWGTYILVAQNGYGGIATIYAPILMTFLLMYVSGVPILERQMSKTNPKYNEYKQKTAWFFPWFPKDSVKNN